MREVVLLQFADRCAESSECPPLVVIPYPANDPCKR
jgi:hypothetical protein